VNAALLELTPRDDQSPTRPSRRWLPAWSMMMSLSLRSAVRRPRPSEAEPAFVPERAWRHATSSRRRRISKSGTSVLPPILARRSSPFLTILYNVALDIESWRRASFTRQASGRIEEVGSFTFAGLGFGEWAAAIGERFAREQDIPITFVSRALRSD
jgi:hypothetical protein